MSVDSQVDTQDADLQLIDALARGELRIAARLITRIESGDSSVASILSKLHARGGNTTVLGVTGPPGAGKSTLVDRLLQQFRHRGQRVAVLAVDPSSPFSGGAILGDRIRMNQHSADEGVFIRSMAARGRLGGLAVAAGDALQVLDAMGWDLIVVETVGVGQSEIDILRHAHTVVIVQTPASGDAVQSVKAGLLEVGDIFVVNKADTAGADRMQSNLREATAFRADPHDPACWLPPVLKTQATYGSGIDAVIEAIDAHTHHRLTHPARWAQRLRAQMRVLLLEQLIDLQRRRTVEDPAHQQRFERALDEVLARRCDPHTAARKLLDASE